MLSYNIRDLDQHAAKVDGTLPANDPIWAEGDPVPATPAHVTGRLSKAGAGRYYWSGRIEGTAVVECRRCLTDVTVPVAEDVHVMYVEAGDEVAVDPDAYQIPSRAPVIDLRPAVREQWLLGVPSFAVCREECKGICSRCGADLNAGPCECPPETDDRWAALREHRDAGSAADPHNPE